MLADWFLSGGARGESVSIFIWVCWEIPIPCGYITLMQSVYSCWLAVDSHSQLLEATPFFDSWLSSSIFKTINNKASLSHVLNFISPFPLHFSDPLFCLSFPLFKNSSRLLSPESSGWTPHINALNLNHIHSVPLAT